MIKATDILIVTTSHGAGTVEEFTAHPPAGQPVVDLGRGLSIERLPSDKAEVYMDACEPRGMDPPAVRQFGQRNAFVRRDAPNPDRLIWDPDGTITTALALSRFIIPNAHGVEYAVRLIEHNDGIRIIPLPFEARFKAYVPDPTARDWLDQTEAGLLRDLLARFWRDREALLGRVSRAIWLSEYGSRVAYVDVAWPHVVTSLEALLNTDRSFLRRQFVTRAPALAREVGITAVDDAFADDAYTIRSQAVHGTEVSFDDDPTVSTRLGLLQRVLQLALKRAIEDVGFRTTFASTEAIRARWPVATT